MNGKNKTVDDKWMGTTEAATYLGYSSHSLKFSRISGVLGGKSAPSFHKLGSAVRYKKSDLDAWVTGE